MDIYHNESSYRSHFPILEKWKWNKSDMQFICFALAKFQPWIHHPVTLCYTSSGILHSWFSWMSCLIIKKGLSIFGMFEKFELMNIDDLRRLCGLTEIMGMETKLGLALSSDPASCPLNYIDKYVSWLNNCDELLSYSTQSMNNTRCCQRISTNNSCFNLNSPS